MTNLARDQVWYEWPPFYRNTLAIFLNFGSEAIRDWIRDRSRGWLIVARPVLIFA